MSRASSAQVEQRVTEVLAVLIDGARLSDVCAFVRGRQADPASAWHAEGDATPLSDETIRGYVTRANALIDEEHARKRGPLFRKRVAQLESVYARAIASNELSVARACLRDLIVLQRLIPDPQAELLKKLASVEAKLEAAERARDGKKD